MYIVHIASELAPVAKVGGLGDVIHGLSKQQQKNGNLVEIILPKYDVLKLNYVDDWTLAFPDLWSFEDSFKFHNAVWSGFVDGLKTYFIEPHHNQYYFNRGSIYGSFNDNERFLFFCRAALEFLFTAEKKPDIIHVHDWPTAVIPLLLKTIYTDLGFSYGASVMTIHNLEHQGKCHPRYLTRIGLRGEDYRTLGRLQDPVDPSLLNLLKGGIVYADKVTTVSPNYLKEIKTSEYGFHLDPIIQKHQNKIEGILNGIEIETWSPAKDPNLISNYPADPKQIDLICKLKRENREELCRKLQKKNFSGPLFVCISRIAKQKGPNLIIKAILSVLEKGGSFILLGSSPDTHLIKQFELLQNHFHSHPNVYISLEFNEALAHLVFASADAILIPSLYEPCGLTQMIAMRYGTVPIARKTGGLADTISDVDDPSIAQSKKTGFLFETPTEASMDEVINRAFACYNNPPLWRTLIQNGLSTDFSWTKSAIEYQKVYSSAINQAHPVLEKRLC